MKGREEKGANMDGTLRNMASVYISKGDRMLLLYRQGGRVVHNVWVGSAGGHFETYELNDARACVLREMREELGIAKNAIEHLRLRYVILRNSKGEIRQNYFFFADLKDGIGEDLVSNEGVCRWFQVSKLASLEMPFSARYVVDHYLAEGCHTNMIYAGAADGEKVVFTQLPEF